MAVGSSPDPAGSGHPGCVLPLEGCPLTADQLAEQAAIVAEQEAWGLHDLVWPGAASGDWHAEDDLAGAAAPDARQLAEQDAILAEIVREIDGDPDPVLEPYPDVSTHDHDGLGGPGFSSGSALDRLLPGPGLAAALDDTFAHGLAGLDDDQLAGVILAARRCESRAAAQVLAAVAELDHRRSATQDLRLIEHTDTELALLLTMTRRAAGQLQGFATDLAVLPATATALAEGRIHRAQADVIAFETELLDSKLAAAVEQLVIEHAPG